MSLLPRHARTSTPPRSAPPTSTHHTHSLWWRPCYQQTRRQDSETSNGHKEPYICVIAIVCVNRCKYHDTHTLPAAWEGMQRENQLAMSPDQAVVWPVLLPSALHWWLPIFDIKKICSSASFPPVTPPIKGQSRIITAPPMTRSS